VLLQFIVTHLKIISGFERAADVADVVSLPQLTVFHG